MADNTITNENVNEEPKGTASDEYDVEEPEDDFDAPASTDFENNPEENQAEVEESDDEEEQPEQQEETEDTQSETVSDDLIEQAKQAGLQDSDIQGFNASQLEKVISLVKPEKTEKSEEKQTQETEQDDSEDFSVELDPDIYDPDICKAISGTAKQIKSLKTQLDSVMNALSAQNQQNFEREFDGMVAGLGDEFEDTLGKGGIDAIGTDSDHFKNRCKVIEEMTALAVGFSETGKAVPSTKKLFERAVNSIFGDTVKTNARKEIASQLQKRSRQIISRPTSRNGKDTLTPERRAVNIVNEKLREFGAYSETEINEDF